MILMDVSAWFALLYEAHPHHRPVREWKSQLEEDLALCRVTQMSLSRLLTNRAAMADDVLSRAQAWRVLDRLGSDEQVVFSPEPDGLDLLWRSLSAHEEFSHKLWTDDYLAAFALAGGMSLATLDRQFAARYGALGVITIGRSVIRDPDHATTPRPLGISTVSIDRALPLAGDLEDEEILRKQRNGT